MRVEIGWLFLESKSRELLLLSRHQPAPKGLKVHLLKMLHQFAVAKTLMLAEMVALSESPKWPAKIIQRKR
jgi:hypothetical protein